MAITRLNDIIVPEVFSPYVREKANTTSRLVASGAVAMDGTLSSFLAGGGATFQVPSWKSIDGVIFNSDNDNPASVVTPGAVTSGLQIATRLKQNLHIGTSRFTNALAGSNPLESVAGEAANIYNANRQAHLVKVLDGLFGTGGALETESVGAATWSSDLLIDAEAKVEDFTDGTGLLIVKPAVFADMRKENLVSFRPLSEQQIVFPDYLGYAVIVDANLGDADAYMVKPGAIRMGVGSVFADTYEDEKAGNGGGVQYLRMLDEYMLHVEGVAWKGTAINPAAADLANVANWEAVYDMKHIGVKRIKLS
jgi:hypothetical protein